MDKVAKPSLAIRFLITFVISLSWVSAKAHGTAAQNPGDIPNPLLPINIPQSGNIIYVPGLNDINLQTAVLQVADEGIIEIASGTYFSPSQGFDLSDLNKNFTIQAAPGATVILDGRERNRILTSMNRSAEDAGHVVFKNIVFANGFSSTDFESAITLKNANATFIDSSFQNNVKSHSSPGGALKARFSTVFFYHCTWTNNISNGGGAGLDLRDSMVTIHNSMFANNQGKALTTDAMPRGAAINAAHSTLRITNTRFDGNIAGGHGAAIWAKGDWDNTRMDLLVVNSTFINNEVARNIASEIPIAGGAITVENRVLLRVFSSRFINNRAEIGGAIDIFRGKAEIYDSIFLGNQAFDYIAPDSGGWGGAINLNYYDRPDYARLTIENTLIQGSYNSVSIVAEAAGGLHVGGITSQTRPQVTLRRVIFNDLDVINESKASAGGAMNIKSANLLMSDSYVLNSDASGPSGGVGGGIIFYSNTLGEISRTTFANNSADTFGGGIYSIETELSISDSIFLGNEISPGVLERESESYGAALFTTPGTSGVVENTMFINNVGIPLYDQDQSYAPINSVVYNNNQFYETTFGDKVYVNTLTTSKSVQGLNNLVVNHSGGAPPIDKSVIPNIALSIEPVIAKLIAAPRQILSTAANGDPSQTTLSYLGYVWNGASASLDGSGLSDRAGIQPTGAIGAHTLSVDGVEATIQVTEGEIPGIAVSYSQDVPPIVSWNIQGAFLDAVMDQGVAIAPAATGSVQLPSINRIYQLYVVTEEGGAVRSINPKPPSLLAPYSITVLVGKNLAINRGFLLIQNTGGRTMFWSAQTSTPDLLQLETLSGSTETQALLSFIIDASGLATGQYAGSIEVDAGLAGYAQIDVVIIVVDHLYQTFAPLVFR